MDLHNHCTETTEDPDPEEFDICINVLELQLDRKVMLSVLTLTFSVRKCASQNLMNNNEYSNKTPPTLPVMKNLCQIRANKLHDEDGN